MIKIFNKLGSWIKGLFLNLFKFIITRQFAFYGILCTWIIPIWLLNEQIALLKDVPTHIPFTFTGCLVVLVVLIALRKRIYASIIRLKNGLTRAILLTISKSITYGLIFAVLWAGSYFIDKLYAWWKLAGISIAIGAVCYIIDEIIQVRKTKIKEAQEKEKLKEEIKAELKNE